MPRQSKRSVLFFLYVSLVALFAQQALAQVDGRSEDWTLQKDEEGIRVYTRNVEHSSFDAFRGEIELDAKLNEVVAILADVPDHRDWMKDITVSEMIGEFDPDGYHTYGRTDAPWPVSDRDYVVRWSIKKDSDGRAVTLHFRKAEGVRPPVDDAVRTGEFVGFWRLEPLQDGGTRVIYEVSDADPSGMLPAWLVNAFVVNQPYATLLAMRRKLEKEQYGSRTFSFL